MGDNELKLLIPSKYVREHIKSEGFELSDSQRAALMINGGHSINVKFDYV